MDKRMRLQGVWNENGIHPKRVKSINRETDRFELGHTSTRSPQEIGTVYHKEWRARNEDW
jgi:hypothetical protein